MSSAEENGRQTAIGDCPHCAHAVSGFLIDAESRDDVVITLRPCECASHSTDRLYPLFAALVKASGSLEGDVRLAR